MYDLKPLCYIVLEYRICTLQSVYSRVIHVLFGKATGTRVFNLLKPSGFFTYHQVLYSEFLLGARFALSVLYYLRTDSNFCFLHH